MFDKIVFRNQLLKLMNGCSCIEFVSKTGFNRTYLSKYLNLRKDKPPLPKLLKSISNEYVTYEELMLSCGYFDFEIPINHDILKIPIIKKLTSNKNLLSSENIQGYEYINGNNLLKEYKYCYAYPKQKNIITKKIHVGDMILIRLQDTVNKGDTAVFSINNNFPVIKKINIKNNQIVLPYQNLGTENIHIIGKVLHIRFNI